MSFGGGSSGSSRIATASDVALNNPANSQVLTYDSTVAKWVNAGANGTTITDYGDSTGAITQSSTSYPYATPLKVASIISSSGSLSKGYHTPIDASGGNIAMTLPSTANAGAMISVERIDSTSTTVYITGNFRGTADSYSLPLQHQTVEFIADSSGYWWPLAAHEPLALLDSRYQVQNVVQLDGSTDTVVNGSGIAVPIVNYTHAMHGSNFMSGRYYPGISIGTNVTTSSSYVYLMPFMVNTTHSFDQIGVNVATMTAGSSGTLRYGVWADNGSLYPGLLIAEAQASGAMSTTGSQGVSFTSSWTASPNLYWLGLVVQSASTQPSLTGASANLGQYVFGASSFGSSGTNIGYVYATSVTGSFTGLGGSFPSGAVMSASAPLIQVRAV